MFATQSLCGVLGKTCPQCEILEDISGGPSLEYSPETLTTRLPINVI